jgi:hypothetical protein
MKAAAQRAPAAALSLEMKLRRSIGFMPHPFSISFTPASAMHGRKVGLGWGYLENDLTVFMKSIIDSRHSWDSRVRSWLNRIDRTREI